MPLTFLPFILLIVPITEIGVFIAVGGNIGPLWTIALVLFTAILGSILLRIEGFRTFAQIRSKLNSGEVPGEELVNGVMILVAGVLLLTPGFITDSIGFALFIPFVRKLFWLFLARRFSISTMNSAYTSPFTHSHNFGGSDSQDGSHYNGAHDGQMDENIVDLDPEDFNEEPNEHSPWRSIDEERKRN